jgi:hypothetical protein
MLDPPLLKATGPVEAIAEASIRAVVLFPFVPVTSTTSVSEARPVRISGCTRRAASPPMLEPSPWRVALEAIFVKRATARAALTRSGEMRRRSVAFNLLIDSPKLSPYRCRLGPSKSWARCSTRCEATNPDRQNDGF